MKLFEKGRIGTLDLKNRIVMDAINIQLGSPSDEAALGQRAVDLYAARARGGVGLIKTTFMRTNRKLELSIGGPTVHSTRSGQWLNEIAQAVHDYGAKLCAQLTIGVGRIPVPNPNLPHGGLVAPSPLPSFRSPEGDLPRIGPGRYPAHGEKHVITRELTIEEIEEIVRDYEFSARIIALAGVDAIEVHAHQGYLIDEFMTALWNKRTDHYGGDLEGRMRLPLELLAAIRRAAGPDYAILYKYPLTHNLEGGREIEEGLEIARMLEAAGVNALTVTAGCYETYNLAQPPTTQPRGNAVHLAEATKKAVNIPVIAVGKLGYPELAEQVLQEGKADFVSLARYLLADPEWPNKVKEGRVEDIRPCIGCHEGCIARVRKNHYCSCAVNPATGIERELAITPAERKKSVLVLGGGPAGMEAARVATLRGHKVTLWEKANALGGQLIPASVPDFKEDYRILLSYLRTQIKKLGITVELEKEVTLDAIKQYDPDVVFVATGASHIFPEIEGIKDGIEKGKVLSAVDVLLGKGSVGEKVLVMGGGLIGCETALYLAKRGKGVTVVKGRPIETLSIDMPWGNALDLVKLLDDYAVKVFDETNVLRITQTGADIADRKSEERSLVADTIVIARGMKPTNGEFLEAVQENLSEVHVIGDCVKPRRVMNAIWEGYRRARVI
jgi:2-enoate reductase